MTCLLLTNPLAATILNVVSSPYVAFRSVVAIAIDRQGGRPRHFNNTVQSALHCTNVLQQMVATGSFATDLRWSHHPLCRESDIPGT